MTYENFAGIQVEAAAQVNTPVVTFVLTLRDSDHNIILEKTAADPFRIPHDLATLTPEQLQLVFGANQPFWKGLAQALAGVDIGSE